MRKVTFILSLLLFGVIYSDAQLPNGSNVPDFTVTDINGNQHTLSSYLNTGKTVILEFSGVGCGASWKYLRTEALQDFYNAYGLPGSNEAVVLFIERSTTIGQLEGEMNTGFGNWLEGTPFPMVLDTAMHSLYVVNYEPLIYRICPNGIISNMGQPSAATYASLVNGHCVTLSGVQNYARVIGNINGFCDRRSSFNATLKNYGSNNIITATLKLRENGAVIGTKKFTGNISQFATAIVEFDAVNINPSSHYTTELADVNGVQNYNPVYSTAILPFNIAKHTGINLQVKTYTNKCPAGMSWEITNSAGIIMASSDRYGTPGPSCDWTNGGKILEQDIVLSDTKDCYSLSLKSADGFGWKNYGYDYVYQSISPGIEFFSNDILIYSKLNVENFGLVLKIENFLTTKDTLSTPAEPEITKLNIFPNPSQGIIYVNSELKVTIRVFNSIGQSVFYSENVDRRSTIDLSRLKSGLYIVKIIRENNKVTTQKLVLKN